MSLQLPIGSREGAKRKGRREEKEEGVRAETQRRRDAGASPAPRAKRQNPLLLRVSASLREYIIAAAPQGRRAEGTASATLESDDITLTRILRW